MNPVQKKRREVLLAQQIIGTSKTKKYPARQLQPVGKRINISHFRLKKQ